MNYGEVLHWQARIGGPWEKCRVLVPLGSGAVSGVLMVLLRLRDQTRVVLHQDGSITEGLPA